MTPQIQVLVPQSWSTTQRGNFFENVVAAVFERLNFSVIQRIRVTGMEIDILAQQKFTKERAYIECKFLSDPVDSPTISKLIGDAIQIPAVSCAYLVSCSEPGKEAKGTLYELEQKGNAIRGELRFAFIGPADFAAMYTTSCSNPSLSDIMRALPPGRGDAISAASLVLTPDEACWVFEESRAGIPQRAFVVPAVAGRSQLRDYQSFRRLVEDSKRFLGLEIEDGVLTDAMDNCDQGRRQRAETVTTVPMADRFDDYGPARPQDFVGRIALIEDIRKHLSAILAGEHRRRVLAISSHSGFGKSSVILKLASKFRNTRWRNHFYLYPVDSRAATSPLFVGEAIRSGLLTAMAEGFIDSCPVEIDSVEDMLSSPSITNILSQLAARGRIIAIFFDQFEELLVKEQLYGTFDTIRKVAFAVEAIQSNLVLGFSWRTGISVPDAHPAYFMWHSLQDKRADFRLGLFSTSESLSMIANLELNVRQKLQGPLKRHLLEQSRHLPWLLKKLCVHVYRQLASGASQHALIGSQLDARSLFNEDTNDLAPVQLSCLRYIAENSPVDLIDVQDKFSPDVVDFLYGSRLVIRSGHRYSVYWDIFREYLITGEVPVITTTLIFRSQFSTALTVLTFIGEQDAVDAEMIVTNFQFTIKTVYNIVTDLSALFLIKHRGPDEYELADDLRPYQHDGWSAKVANYVAGQLSTHVVMERLRSACRPGESMSLSGLKAMVSDVYATVAEDTLGSYMEGLVRWLRFAGLVEVAVPDSIIRPIREGKDKGSVVIRSPRLVEGRALFLCASGPTQAIELASALALRRTLVKAEVLHKHGRNPAADIVTLGLAKWKGGHLVATEELGHIDMHRDEQSAQRQCSDTIEKCAMSSPFVLALLSAVRASPGQSSEALARSVAADLARDWSSSSGQRYVGAGLTWLRYFDRLLPARGQRSFPFGGESY